MRKFGLLVSALLAMTLFSCQKVDEKNVVVPEAEDITYIDFVNESPDTKTAMTIDGSVVHYSWTEEDTNFAVFAEQGENLIPAVSVEPQRNGEKLYLRCGFETGKLPSSGSVNFVSVMNGIVPTAQTTGATSYDPVADILTGVATADAANLTAKPVAFNFTRTIAVGKITCNNVDGNVESVMISSNQTLVGACSAKGVWEDIPNAKINVTGVQDNVCYFTCKPLANADLTIRVTTDAKKIYQRTITGKEITVGNVKGFKVNFAGCEVVNETATLTNEEIVAMLSELEMRKLASGQTSYIDTDINSASGVWFANCNGLNNIDYLQVRAQRESRIVSPVFAGNVSKVIIKVDKKTAANRKFYALPVDTQLYTEKDDYYDDVIYSQSFGVSTVATGSKEEDLVIVITKPVNQFMLVTTDGAAYVRSITVIVGDAPTTYSVNVADGITGGTVTASTYSAVEGETVTLTATPSSGYEFDSWNVTKATTSEAIEVVDGQFTMPAADVNVSATFSKKQSSNATYWFKDMDDFAEWGTTYGKHSSTFDDGAYVELGAANHSTTTIDDMPVSKGGYIIFKAPEGKTIVDLTFNAKQWTTKAQTITLHISTDGETFTATTIKSSNFTLSASGLENVVAVKFTFSSTSNQIGYESLDVKYGAAPVPVTTYDVTCATVEGGTISASPAKAAEGATVTLTATPAAGYEFESWNVTNASTSASITVTDNQFIMPAANVNVSATFAEKEVESLKTMDEIFAAATAAGSTATDAKITFNNWVVSGVKNSNAYVTDGTKGLIIYASGHGFAVGDILSGTVNCKVQLYNGASELTSLTSSTAGLTVTKGGSVTPQSIAITELSGVNTGAVITFEELTYNGTAFSDGANTITPYNTFMTLPTLVSGKKYSVTGVYIQFKDTKEIAPRTDEDIVEKVAPKYAVTVASGITNGTVTVDYPQATEGQTVTITATPATNYIVKSVSAKKTASGTAITVTDNKFTMPAEDVTVSAEFEENQGGTSTTVSFDDLGYQSWGKSAAFSGSTYDELTQTKNNVTFVYSRGSGSTYANTTSIRFYKDNKLTFSAPAGCTITSIEWTGSGWKDDVTTNVATCTSTTEKLSWTGNASSVTFTRPSSATSYITLSKVVVTYVGTGTGTGTGTGSETPTEYTTTFSNSSWANTTDDTMSWTSGKNGSFQTDRGVQVTTNNTGANATTNQTFTKVSKIVVTYSTNASNGVGTINVKVGSGTEKTFNVTKPSSGGTTDKETTFTFDPSENGAVTLRVTCSTNSVYIKKVVVTATGTN